MHERVDVRHINYNDFLPLTAERDLNYRYPAWRAGAGAPDSPFLITGCARAFQESDSRHNSRVMGQSLTPSLYPPLAPLLSLTLTLRVAIPPTPASFPAETRSSSKIYRPIRSSCSPPSSRSFSLSLDSREISKFTNSSPPFLRIYRYSTCVA